MIPFLFLFRRECHRFMKVLIQTILTPLVSAALYLLIFGVSFGAQMEINGERYLAFLIPGLMMMGLMNNAFQNSSSSLVSSKFTGDIEDLAVVPLSQNHIIWALSLASVVRGSLVALMTFSMGEIFYWLRYGELMTVAHPLWLLFFLATAGLVFGQMGLLAAFWARSFDQLSAISAFIILPLTYLGGVFISISQLPPLWQTISLFNPLLYFINGLRFSIVGQSDVEVRAAAGVALLALILMYGLAVRVLSRVSFSRW